MDEAQRALQASQLPGLPPQLSLHVPPRRQPGAGSLDSSSLPASAAAAAAVLQEPFHQPDFQYLSIANGTIGPDTMAKSKQQSQQNNIDVPASDRSSLMRKSATRQPARKTRYYSQALSEEDKQALSIGQKNHNLREWEPKDLVNHHEARRNLVPRAMDKVEESNALAGIEKDKQTSQRALSTLMDKVRRLSKLPRLKVTSDVGETEEFTYTQPHYGSQSVDNLRSSSAPAPQLSPISLSPLTLADHPPLDTRAAHTRAASSGDYFSRPFHPLSSHPSSVHTSGTSSRVRSPLSQEVQVFQHNPDITFDTFLAPHKLGKGEAYRGSENAKKPKTPKASPKDSPAAGPKPSRRRMGKMPSMPSLRKRSPQPGISGEV